MNRRILYRMMGAITEICVDPVRSHSLGKMNLIFGR